MTDKAIDPILEICQIHAKRLNYAIKKIEKHIPITAENLKDLNEDDIGYFDLFSTRFSKLQDYMGAKLFPLVLELAQEHGEIVTFIDRINRLEKLQAIQNARRWLEFREMRNELFHEYPNDYKFLAKNINAGFEMAKELLEYFENIKRFIQNMRKNLPS